MTKQLLKGDPFFSCIHSQHEKGESMVLLFDGELALDDGRTARAAVLCIPCYNQGDPDNWASYTPLLKRYGYAPCDAVGAPKA